MAAGDGGDPPQPASTPSMTDVIPGPPSRAGSAAEAVGEVVDSFSATHTPHLAAPYPGHHRSPADDGALRGVVIAVSALLLLLFGSILALWIAASLGDVELGGPDPMLTAWQAQHAANSGFDALSDLTGEGVTVCIVDSGIDLAHPDLEGRSLAGWTDLIDGRSEPYDDEGHGTSMAGILVADGGLDGLAKGVDLLIAKAMDQSGQGDDQTIAAAVDWCVTEDADVVSLSLGGAAGFSFLGASTDELERAVNDAIDAGVYVIAAAGNDGEDDDGDVESPGSVRRVICVGGSTRIGTIWSGSSEGDNNGRLFPPMLPRSDPDRKPELIAPGHEVPVLIASGTGSPSGAWWGWSSGTSDSTVYVTAAVSLMLQAAPEMARDGSEGGPNAIERTKEWISQTSEPIEGQSGHDDRAGYGRLRADLVVANATA